MAWYPPKTAPRDGSIILIKHNRGTWRYSPDPVKINCVVVFWSAGRFNEFGPDMFFPSEIEAWTYIEEPPA